MSHTPTTRVCYRCGVERDLSLFYVDMERRRAERQGRKIYHAPCRVCQREINQARRAPRQEYTDRVKLEAGCADCGIRSEHPEIYDFDHIAGGKTAGVAARLTRGSWEDLLAEIERCEVVCANCHRIRTRARQSLRIGHGE